MTIYIVLFRGINVGGSKKVKMETLRNVLVEAGFEGVKTYVQSGNVVLRSNKTARQIAETISGIFSKTFSFESRVSIRNIDEWNCMIAKILIPKRRKIQSRFMPSSLMTTRLTSHWIILPARRSKPKVLLSGTAYSICIRLMVSVRPSSLSRLIGY